MPKHNAANERIKWDYFEYLREAKRLSTPSIDAAAKAISRFAWSLNMGHEKPMTTLRNYGKMTTSRQGEIMRGFSLPAESEPSPADLEARLSALEAKIKASG